MFRSRHAVIGLGLTLVSLLPFSTALAAGVSAERQGQLERLLLQDCGSCHGMRLTGGLGPALVLHGAGDVQVHFYRCQFLADLAEAYAAEAPPKGEVVVLIGPAAAAETSAEDLDDALARALEGHSLKDAVATVASATGLPRKRVYARALELAEK